MSQPTPYETPAYTITTAPDTPGTALTPASGHAPALAPGTQVVTLPTGEHALAHLHPGPPEPAPPQAAQPIPAWAKGTALVTGAAGAGIGAASAGLSLLVPTLTSAAPALAAPALAAAGLGVAAAGAGIAAAARALRAPTTPTADTGPDIAVATAHGRGPLGRRITATATATIRK
ncbi:hypothetical protein [Streptomyces aidingensis]|uniref:Uncharacterized protein n=1 Tax=Streptomyces aidingensis TaxID=910347 RepID=A0A1I1PVV3_9ACTN|nr:hypothetical protein [Streptomyces aidingensis]SFD13986.1 hypothetical protein SAMN05421773_11087 [Streptomyces aidingensis]